MSDPRDPRAMSRCVCATLRRTDRVVTQFYDEILAPSGLSATQFGLLATLAAVAPIPIQRLAAIMTLDRTTLTRNLALLRTKQLVGYVEGADRRVRRVKVSEEGQQALDRAWPLWQAAQARLAQALGPERFEALLTELAAVVAVAR